MKHRALVRIIFSLLMCISVSTYATEFPGLPVALPNAIEPGAKVMFIYVVFPTELPGAGYPGQAAVDSVSIGLVNHLRNQSGGRYDMQAIVPVNPDHPNGWWVADHPASMYNNYSSVHAIQQYEGIHWGGTAGGSYLGELQAEVLHKVHSAFAGQTNPFTDVALINFIYHGNAIEMPGLPGVNGYGYNSAVKATFDFLSVMRGDMGDFTYCVPGCQEEDDGRTTWDLRWIVSHETGHRFFGSGHCPHYGCSGSGPEEYYLSPTQRFYGPYCNLRLVEIGGKGPTPFHPVNLIKRDWLQATTINHSEIGFVLGDVRLSRQVLKVPLPGLANQYFLLSYHGGNGMDMNLGEDGNPIYLSRGLAVWHICGDSVWDLESAWGRFDDPAMPADGPGFWIIPNASSGFDNLDVWKNLCGQDHQQNDFSALYDYFEDYPGSERDFFGAMSGQSEFSFRTNPNANGQTLDTDIGGPQDSPNAIAIRIIEETQSAVTLDILLQAYEDVLTPNGGEVLQRGQPYNITWSTNFTQSLYPGGARISSADIVYVACEGCAERNVATGVSAASGSYTWTPGAGAAATTTGKIKIRYHYSNGYAVISEDQSDGVFTLVGLPEAKFTNVSGQTGLAPPGVPYSAAPGDFQPDGMNDLLITATGGDVALGRVTLVQPSGAPLFGNATVSNIVDGRGVAVADFDNDGDQDFFLAHETTPKLYRNQNGTFFDVTGALASLAAPSTTACWGDYDRDGWLDLYVVRSYRGYTEPPDYLNVAGEGHRLFRNLGASGGGFADVTAAAGIDGIVGNGSVSASWGDIDGDGDLDLIVVSLESPPEVPGNGGSYLLVNQGNGTFEDEFASRLPEQIYSATAAQWADLNNDGYLDLAVSCAQPGSAIYFNDGTGHFPAEDRVWFDTSGDGYSGVQVFDHDLDGWNDVLWISRSTIEPSQFFSGVPTASGVRFLNNTGNVGLSGSSKAMGAVAADFTRDGDLDLFVGRSSSSDQYFYKTDSRSGANSLGRSYVKVRLDSPLKANNRQGIGATVTVTAGDLVQTRLVDGGSGRGCQQDRELIFGLGDYAGAVTATVKWPRGHVQSDIPLFVSGPATVDSVNTVVDETMVISNLNAISYVVPGTTLFDWVLSWDTNVACDSNLDALTIDQAGIQNPCWPGWTTLTPSTPGIVYTYEPKPSGGYLHKFAIYGQDCNLGCSFRYSAFSAMGVNQATSATKTKTVKFCPSGF